MLFQFPFPKNRPSIRDYKKSMDRTFSQNLAHLWSLKVNDCSRFESGERKSFVSHVLGKLLYCC